MHGMTSETMRRQLGGYASRAPWLVRWVSDHRKWLSIVVLPTLLVALYFALFAANQYQSEAHFTVRSSAGPATETSGLGQALTLVGGSNPSQTDALSVGDYLDSHDAVAALSKRMDLVAMFRRPESDLLTRMWWTKPSAENLLKYYRSKVEVTHQSETGLMIVKVRSFRPEDSYAIINAMLSLGEARVNTLNDRLYQTGLGVAREPLAEAEAGVTRAQRALTAYRQGRRNIDPQATGEAQVGLVSQLQAQLSAARAQQAALGASLSTSSPQYQAAARRVTALAAQVGAQEGRLTGGRNNIAGSIGGFEELQLRQNFAAKRYDAAAASLQKAREQAQRQQLFIVRVVEPNLPQKAEYPKGLKTVLTVFFALLLAYAIGWLIAAGMKEHAA